MKRIFLLLFLSLLPLACLQAQQRFLFLFPDFEEGHIHFINRSVADVRLNFDALGQTVYYYDGDVLMELTNLNMVSRLEADERTFVVHDDLLCEVIEREKGRVLVNWRFKNVNTGSVGALGATTQSKVEALHSRSEHSQEMWQKKNDNTYFFTVGDREYRVKRLKDLYKAFPQHAAALKAFAKENELTMTNADDAFRVFDYLWSL